MNRPEMLRSFHDIWLAHERLENDFTNTSMPCGLFEKNENLKMILTELDVPTEGVRHVQDETTAYVEGTNQGNGSLYITER